MQSPARVFRSASMWDSLCGSAVWASMMAEGILDHWWPWLQHPQLPHDTSYRMRYRCLKKGVTEVRGMSRGSVGEHTEARRGRYRRSSRKEKGKILDEFTQTAGYHRKANVRVLRREHGPPVVRRGRPPEYGPELVKVLKLAWDVTDHLCGKRLKPFLPELLAVLVRQRELVPALETAEQLGRTSAASIDRLLKPYRRRGMRRSFSTTKPGRLLKGAIPIRTFADWDEGGPGFVEADLVAHCGESAEGLCLTSLCAVDVATAPGPTGRTTAATWSRRTGRW